MRHLLDTYIQAEDSKVISSFDEMSLVELIVEQGQAVVAKLPENIRKNDEAVAETIENNLRKLIIDEQPINPKYYDTMSELLDALIQARKQKALEYKEYLDKLVELAKQAKNPADTSTYPPSLDTSAKQALYDNLSGNEVLAIQIDMAVRHTKKSGWRGHRIKEREVMNAIREENWLKKQKRILTTNTSKSAACRWRWCAKPLKTCTWVSIRLRGVSGWQPPYRSVMRRCA